ncbi:MAG: tetratricopeptide repeat-containing protein [Desulfovibrionaceae bacterium]|nr:tetratricopeptide repeat-containing protein [Desulfovibrionaceae bacterium]MCL2123841.1 tetratricopeptide repeat-containing protein [Desulfovibrionaceae bacterium]
MKAKIDWYKEVLELEPGSKVFFPLARLLAENGQLHDALSTLRLGLERHPEFIEARLYLVELLYKNGQIVQCESQVGQLTRLFSKYPGFWEAWGACSAATEKRRDIALTLRFLAMLLQYSEIGLAEVLEKGLDSLVVAQEAMPLPPDAEAETRKKNFPADALSVPLTIPVDMQASADTTAVAAINEPSPAVENAEEGDETEEPFTLRTKSMADVLAGQGDINGALEIYRELALRAESPEEGREFNERIAQLSSQQQPGDTSSSSSPDEPPSGKQRMQHLLESLAERLEARALG